MPPPKELLDQLADKVLVGDGCWEWTASTMKTGYGQLRTKKPDGTPTMSLAHRVMYELLVGPIPAGLQLDHLCHNADPNCPGGDGRCVHRRCVRPDHLEPVTHRENGRRGKSVLGVNARKTHCKYGHPFDEANTRIVKGPRGWPGRSCIACDKRREMERAARRRQS